MYSFKNDYNTIASKKVLESLLKYNEEQNVGYGEDYHSKNVNKIMNEKCNANVDTYVLAGGTITNIIGLCQILKNPYDAVMCVESGHINVHETGAIESQGHKIIKMFGKDGKVVPSEIEQTYKLYTDHHMVLPKCVYISNSTEIGTTYTLNEIKEISAVCKKLNLYLFLDGARLGVALASKSNDLTLADIAKYTDMFYIGGTKNGAMFGELLVICNDDLKPNFKYLLKNKLGLLAKGFVGAIMFEVLLQDDYYLELASHSNSCAQYLRENLKDYIVYPNETNQTFIYIPSYLKEILEKEFLFEIWENKEDGYIIRIVTSYYTDQTKIVDFVEYLQKNRKK